MKRAGDKGNIAMQNGRVGHQIEGRKVLFDVCLRGPDLSLVRIQLRE